MKRAMIVLCLLSTPAAADDLGCFVVVTPTNINPIRYNRCTGDSWLLIKEVLPTAKPTDPESFVWRWAPLYADPSEAVLSAKP